MTEVETYESRIGAVLVRALEVGGEPLLDAVDQTLGVVHRHLHRVRTGVLTLTPGVTAEIEAAFARAEQLLPLQKYEHWTGPDGNSLFRENNEQAKALEIAGGNKRCCVIEAKDWNDAQTQYHAHMGWEPYVPMDDQFEPGSGA